METTVFSEIRKRRRLLEMTQCDLASRAGIALGTLSLIERNLRPNTSYLIIERLLRALDTAEKDAEKGDTDDADRQR